MSTARAEKYRIKEDTHKAGDKFGRFLICRIAKPDIRVIASFSSEYADCPGQFWDHVSVSLSARKMPTWNDMCFVKSLFWEDEDCVVQFHPPRSEYVNNVENCLHLWCWTGGEFPRPSSILVGVKGVKLIDS